MNKTILKGRITKDIELKQTSAHISYCNFTLAVDRRFKDANGNKQTDFIPCTAWRQTADFINKYFSKGSEILVTGELQSRTYDKQDGTKAYVYEVNVEEVDFCGSARRDEPSNDIPKIAPVESTDDIQLPFEI